MKQTKGIFCYEFDFTKHIITYKYSLKKESFLEATKIWLVKYLKLIDTLSHINYNFHLA
jgi:hypothetical protein